MAPETGAAAPGRGGQQAPDEDATVSVPKGMVVPAATRDDMPQTEARAGRIFRVNTARTVEATCEDCGAAFASTGPAASHSRSARHRVDVVYQSEFTFAPVESLGGVVGGGN